MAKNSRSSFLPARAADEPEKISEERANVEGRMAKKFARRAKPPSLEVAPAFAWEGVNVYRNPNVEIRNPKQCSNYPRRK